MSLYLKLKEGWSDPDAVALDDGMVSLTYGELDAMTGRTAAALLARGLGTGDRVGLAIPKSIGQVVVFLAALRAGLAIVPMDPAAPRPVLADMIGRTGVRLVLGEASVLEELPNAVAAAVSPGADPLCASGLTASAAEPLPAETEALILFTSGSTGRAKGVAYTHGRILASVGALRNVWNITAADRLLHALPMTHAHGLIVALLPLLLAAGRIDLRPRFDAADVVARLHHATCFMGLPFYYAQLLAHPGFGPGATAGIRLFTCGSAPLQADLRKAIEARTGKPLLERYGMTETLITTANGPTAYRSGSVGRVLPGAVLRVRDLETGELVGPGAEGEVEVRGDFVFEEYLDDPGETARAFREDGFFRTGDVGRVDAEGYLVLSGRVNDLIIYAGIKIYPAEIEAELLRLDGVAEACVFGVPHPSAGATVVAAVVPVAGTVPVPARLRAGLVGRLPATKIPKRILIVPALPRNAMGKIRRGVLRNSYQAGDLGDAWSTFIATTSK